MKIFISYAHDDEYRVRELVDILRASDHAPWFDHRLKVGQSWEEQLLEAIRKCDRFLYALTPESFESKWCQWEFAQAVHAKKPVIPVLLRKVPKLDGVLSEVQYADFSKGPSPINAAQMLAGVLERKLIDPARVPLLDAPHDEDKLPEKLVVSGPPVEDLIYDEAYKAFRVGRYDVAHFHLRDCLAMNPDHENAAKLMKAVKERFQDQQRTNVIARAAADRPLVPQPFEWIDIPAGTVTLEDASKQYAPPGTDGGRYRVPAFVIAKYPITNAQFQVFVDAADGYREPEWWEFSRHARAWRGKHDLSKNSAFLGDDLPRTNVCWYEAMAYCHWLSVKTKHTITLPTEQQWQRAAQGNDEREFPWGNEPPTNVLCNFGEQVGKTSPVTDYPDGASSYEVLDMAGNVWEWCLTTWGKDSTNVQGNVLRVLRGGSWDMEPNFARVASRIGSNPNLRYNSVGFRVVCARRPASKAFETIL